MKKFKFNLEPVLKVRQHKVDKAKNELAKVVIEKVKRQDAINVNLDEIKELESRGTKNDLRFLQNRQNRIDLLLIDNKRLKSEIKNIEEIESLRRRELTELMKKEKAIEKLKDKKREEHTYKINKEENDFIDEIASRSFRSLLQ